MEIREENIDPQEVEEKEKTKEKVEEKPKEFKDTKASKTIEEIFPNTIQLKAEELLDKPITVKEIRERESPTYGNTYLWVLAKEEDRDVSFSIGASVVVAKLQKLKKDNDLPCNLTLFQEKSQAGRMYYNVR